MGDWRRTGGGSEEDWTRIGGLEEDWRRVGRGLEEGWRRAVGGLEEHWEKVRGGLGALKMAENREKLCFTFFAFLPPYIGVSGSLTYAKR